MIREKCADYPNCISSKQPNSPLQVAERYHLPCSGGNHFLAPISYFFEILYSIWSKKFFAIPLSFLPETEGKNRVLIKKWDERFYNVILFHLFRIAL
jgi:hypothetical protein